MILLSAIGALCLLVAALALYVRRRERRAAFTICAALGVALAIANLLMRLG